MGYTAKLYEAFKDLGEEKAKVIVEAIEEAIEHLYRQKPATSEELRIMELKLIEKLEQYREETKQMELRLMEKMEQYREETRQMELRLTEKIANAKASVIKWSFIFWTSQLAVMAGIILAVFKLLTAH